MPTNIVLAIVGGITIGIVILIVACVFIDHENFVNLDGGE